MYKEGNWICGGKKQFGKIKTVSETGYVVNTGEEELSWGDAVTLATESDVKDHLIKIAEKKGHTYEKGVWKYDFAADNLNWYIEEADGKSSESPIYSNGIWRSVLKREIKSSQKYEFEIVHYKDGSSAMRRQNTGFSAIEMLGITAMLQHDLMVVLRSGIRPVDDVKINSTDSPFIHKPTEEK